ncbi:MAG TPA: cytochrome c [Bryobacteraceae bacterium]|jgi:hypothetical protein|nr:cytochrome c [Bryobacteraceae bacterium]
MEIRSLFALPLLAALVVPATAQRKPARPQITRPDGPVWDTIRKNCTRCHGIDDYAFFALDKSGWDKLIDSKHGATKFAMSGSERGLLVDYLAANFGPATKPFPRTYVPQEISDFFSDPEAYRLLNRACTGCHALDHVDKQRNKEEGWRAIVLDMRERGASISDHEVEQLVEWLGRVRGTNQDK